MIQKSIFALVLLSVLMSSCNTDRLDVDVSDIKVNIQFSNMDSVLFSTKDSISFLKHHTQWEKSVPDLYEHQLFCFNLRNRGASVNFNNIRNLYEGRYGDGSVNNYMQELENALHSKFTTSNLNARKLKIVDGFKHLKFHLQEVKLPKHITFINSLFSTAIYCGNEGVSVGLDWYLGGDHRLVKEVPAQKIDSWMKERMKDLYLERDVVNGWIIRQVLPEIEGNMAEHIVHFGKALYLTEASFPNADKWLILRYSEKDYKWAIENEFAYWDYLINQNLLLSKKELDIANQVNDGPFTPGIPKEDAPDRLGQFIGWRMVKQYMDNNENVTLKEMVTLDYNTILQAFEIEE